MERSLLHAILESASQGILTIGRTGVILSANRRAGELFDYDDGELVGQQVELLLPESLRGRHTGHRQSFFDAPRVRPMGLGLDLSGRRKDGTELPVEISLSYIEEGGEQFAIAFISDITGRKRMEEQLIQSQKMEAVGRLAGGIAHDFNNLLTVIQGYDQFLLKKLAPQDPLRGYAEEILRASERASALTRQLLAFSRRQIIQPVVLNVNSVLKHAEDMLRRLIGEQIQLIFIPAPNLANIEADANQIEQILMNLIINARDAMPQGGRILVETKNVNLDEEYARTHMGIKPGLHVMMAVSDSGRGMDAETKRRIFEPFFTTKPADQGTGLGLSTVYGIVKQMQGDIWVYSEIGQGTTFKVYFPSVAQPESETVSRPGAALTDATGIILLVEDDPAVRSLVHSLLTEEGYVVLEAGDGLEATQVSSAYKGPIDLLITDVIMPHGTGREVAERLAQSRAFETLFISGYTEHHIAHHGVLDPNLDFLAKPFSFEDLLSKVRELLSRRKAKQLAPNRDH
jgi:PAS domain S-box-containing protein